MACAHDKAQVVLDQWQRQQFVGQARRQGIQAEVDVAAAQRGDQRIVEVDIDGDARSRPFTVQAGTNKRWA